MENPRSHLRKLASQVPDGQGGRLSLRSPPRPSQPPRWSGSPCEEKLFAAFPRGPRHLRVIIFSQ
eukprot:8486466-Pyramimonas_sp.AAC.1